MEEEIKESINTIMNDFLSDYLQNSIESGSIASGKLNTTGKPIININNNIYSISFLFEDYFKWAENGRKAGKMPPIEKIKQWIKIKPVLPRPNKNGKLPTESQLAFLISRKIGLKGTTGSGAYKKTLEDFKLVDKIYNSIVDKIMDYFYKTI